MEALTVEAKKVKRNKMKKEERAYEENQVLKRVPRGVGRPKRFTPTKLRNRINDYFAWCEKKMTYPNIKGMMLHLGMSRDQWYQYEKYPEMRPILDWARDAMEAWSMNDLWKTQSSNTNKQLVAKVNHGWQEERTITHINMSKEQALAKLEAFAPMLLDLLKSNLLLNQIASPKEIESEVIDLHQAGLQSYE
jgi:hypothetical protein